MGVVTIPACLISSMVNLHKYRNRWESYSNLLERHYSDSMRHYLTEEEITKRVARQKKRKAEKDLLLKQAISGELPLSEVPVYLRNQVRGIVDEIHMEFEGAQTEVSLECEGFTILVTLDGFEGKNLVEFKSRKNWFQCSVRDRVQICVYCMCTGKSAILRQKLGDKYRDTFFSYEDMKRFWDDILPVLKDSVKEFKQALSGELNKVDSLYIRFWLRQSNH